MANSRVLQRPWWRRGLFAVLILVCAVLTFFPERYRAAVTVTPSDPGSLGLGQALGQLGALNTVFGNQAAIEVSLKIGRSVATRQAVARQLNLVHRLGLANEVEASRWLADNVEVRSLRGGIVQVEVINRDPVFGGQLVTAVTQITRQRLADIARRQTDYKRNILEKLVDGAGDRLDRAQTAYDTFRRQTGYSNPGLAFDAIGGRIPVLQAAIRAKEVELNAAREFATDDNLSVKQIIAEIASLRRQLAQYEALNPNGSYSLGRVVGQSTRSARLERELVLATSLYYNYRNFLAGTVVEDLTSTANVRILETPFIDTERQWNLIPACIGGLLLLILLAIEFYRLRPPVGDRPTYA